MDEKTLEEIIEESEIAAGKLIGLLHQERAISQVLEEALRDLCYPWTIEAKPLTVLRGRVMLAEAALARVAEMRKEK